LKAICKSRPMSISHVLLVTPNRIGIIIHKNVDVNGTRNPRYYGHQRKQQRENPSERSKQTRAQSVRDPKYRHAQENRHAITDIHCHEKERGFHLVYESTLAACRVHFKVLPDIVRIGVHEHFVAMAFRTSSC